MVTLIEHGRTIYNSAGQELIIQLRRPIHAPLVRGISVSGTGYKSGRCPSPTMETRGDLESWAKMNQIPMRSIDPSLVAIADALNSISSPVDGPALIHLTYGRVQYDQTSDRYTASINTDLYLPQELP